SAFLPCSRNRANRSSILLDDVITNPDAIPFRLRSLDDGARKLTIGSGRRKVCLDRRLKKIPASVAHHNHARPGQHLWIRIRGKHYRKLERVEYDQRSRWIDPEQRDERLHHNRIESAARVVAHLLQYGRRRIRLGLVRSPARCSVIRVRHGNDPARHRDGSRANHAGVTGQIAPHVMLVRAHHRTIRKLLLSPQLEQSEHSEPRVRRDASPVVLVQSGGLLKQIGRNARLAYVVHQRRDAKLVELQLGHADSLTERNGENTDVDGVRVSVLVVLTQSRQPDKGRLFRQHLVHDGLHCSLDLPRARHAAHADRVDHILGERDRLRVGASRRSLRDLPLLDLFFFVRVSGGLECIDSRSTQSAHELGRIAFTSAADRRQQREQREPFAWRCLAQHAQRPDTSRAEQVQHAPEAGVIAEIEPQSRAVHENELAVHAQLELRIQASAFRGGGSELAQRLLHRLMLRRVQFHRARCSVGRYDERPSGAPRIGGLFPLALVHRRLAHALPRIARVAALRTTISLSPSALLTASSARSVPSLPSAIAALARVIGSSLRASSPRGTRMLSSSGTDPSPPSVAYASKNAFFSLDDPSRVRRSLMARSNRASTGRYWRSAHALTTNSRMSRSLSSSPRSRTCIAPGDPICASAATAAARLVSDAASSTRASGATAAGDLMSPARRIASSETAS